MTAHAASGKIRKLTSLDSQLLKILKLSSGKGIMTNRTRIVIKSNCHNIKSETKILYFNNSFLYIFTIYSTSFKFDMEDVTSSLWVNFHSSLFVCSSLTLCRALSSRLAARSGPPYLKE